ncbi:MAG: glycosyltransferase family A protein [Actinomycetota bacterium]
MTSVGVGIPVWNGADYLEQAVQSLLAQTRPPDQITIADNASSDDSLAIARGIAACEPTVSVISRPTNTGASFNYNDLVTQVETDLFAWLPHDDRWTPDLLAAMVRVHDEDEVALAYGRRHSIDEHGQRLPTQPLTWDDPAGPIERLQRLFADPLDSHLHDCTAVLGLIRRDVLLDTARIQPFSSSDKVLIVDIALRGRIVPVDSVFERRVHQQSSVRAQPDDASRQRWFDPAASGPATPQLRILRGFQRAVAAAPLPAPQRRHAQRLIIRWAASDGRPRVLAGELRHQLQWSLGQLLTRQRSDQP